MENHRMGSTPMSAHSEGVPMYNKVGRALSHDERAAIARRRGVCVRCGRKTHEGLVRRRPLTDDHVWQGNCISCQPEAIPSDVLAAWDKLQKDKHSSATKPTSVPNLMIAARRSQPESPPHTASSSALTTSSSSNSSAAVPADRVPRATSWNNATALRPQSHHGDDRLSSWNTSASMQSNDSSATAESNSSQSVGAGEAFPPGSASSISTPLKARSAMLSPTLSNESLPRGIEQRRSSLSSSNHSGGGGAPPASVPHGQRRLSTTGPSPVTSTATPAPIAVSQAMASEPANAALLAYREKRPFKQDSSELNRVPKGTAQGENYSVQFEDNISASNLEKLVATLLHVSRRSSLGDSNLINLDDFKRFLHCVRNMILIEDGKSVDLALSIEPLLVQIRLQLTANQSNSRTVTLACGALWRLSTSGDAVKTELSQLGLTSLVIGTLAMHSEDPELATWAIGLLASVALGSGKMALVQEAAVEAVLSSLGIHRKLVSIFEWSCRFLYYLVQSGNAEATPRVDARDIVQEPEILWVCKRIEDAGGLAVIVNTMKYHSLDPSLQLCALKLLHRVVVSTQNDSETYLARSKISDTDFVFLAVKILRDQSLNLEVFQLTMEIVTRILLTLDEGEGDKYDHAIESLPSVINVMAVAKDDVGAQESGCMFLSVVAFASAVFDKPFRDSGAVLAIVHAIERCPQCIQMIEAGAWALWRLSTDRSLYSQQATQRTISVLVHEASRVKSRELVLALCGFFTNAATYDDIQLSDLPAEFFYDIVETTSDRKIGESVFFALSGFCATFATPDLRMPAAVVHKFLDTFRLGSPGTQLKLLPILAYFSRSKSIRELCIRQGIVPLLGARLLAPPFKAFVPQLLDLISSFLDNGNAETVSFPPDFLLELFTLPIDEQQDDLFGKLVAVACEILVNSKNTLNTKGIMDVISAVLTDWPSPDDDLVEVVCHLFSQIASTSRSRGDLESMYRHVLAVFESFNSNKRPFQPKTIIAATRAIYGISGGMRQSPVRTEKEDIDLISTTIYNILEMKSLTEEGLGYLLGSIFNLSKVATDLLIRSGAILVVIDVMVERPKAQVIQEAGCSILATFASLDNLEVNLSIIQSDGIDVLASALAGFPENIRIQSDACRAFASLSSDDESRLWVVAQGGPFLAATAIMSHWKNPFVLENACSALLNLSEEDFSHEEVLNGTNVIEVLLNLVRSNKSSQTLQTKLLSLIRNFFDGSLNGKRAISSSRGAAAVLESLDGYIDMPQIVDRSMALVERFASFPGNKDTVSNAGAIAIVNCMLANIQHASVQQNGCLSLVAIISTLATKVSVKSAGGSEAVTLAMRAHPISEGVQVEGCLALWSIATQAHSQSVLMRSEKEIEAIICSMYRFPNSRVVQERGCKALLAYLVVPENVEIVRNAKVDQFYLVVERAKQNFPGSIAESASNLLAVGTPR